MPKQRDFTVSQTKQLQFANAAIDALGGSSVVAALFRVDCRNVSNWRKRGLPATHYAVLAPMLARLGWDVSPASFGQVVLPVDKALALRVAAGSSNGDDDDSIDRQRQSAARRRPVPTSAAAARRTDQTRSR